LRESEARFRAVANSANDGIVSTDSQGIIFYWNKGANAIFGYTDDEIVGQSLTILMPERYQEKHKDTLKHWSTNSENRPLSRTLEVVGRRKDGIEFPIEVSIGSWNTREGAFFTVIVRDITRRKRSEEQLRKLSSAVEHSPACIVIADPHGAIEYVNPRFTEITGYTLEEVIGKNSRILKSGLTSPEEYKRLWDTIKTGAEWRGEFCNKKKNGELYWELASISPIIDDAGHITHFVAVKEDNTERKLAEELIKKSLAEKETLLRELYHRTKNNMSVIIAMLELQSSYSNDKRLHKAFGEAQDRIRSMALVHQKLYETSDLSHINLKDYIGSLVGLLMTSYRTSPKHISWVLEMEDVLVLIDTAIPCGLILNELISNTLKYAFPGKRTGEIKIQLRRTESGEIQLGVSDTGVGLPGGFDSRRDGHMGLQTIFSLAENQLKAQISFSTVQGVACQLRFKDNLYQPRV
jgi:PAS domain S-box-containing protein